MQKIANIGNFKQVKDSVGNRRYILYLNNNTNKTFKTLYSLLKYVDDNNIKLK